MNTPVLLLVLIVPSLLPAGYRLVASGFAEPVGLLSDLGLGLILFVLLCSSSRWLRIPLLVLWALFQAMSAELYAAVGRFPSWQDVQYLLDPKFVESSASGFHLAAPVYVLLLLGSVGLSLVAPAGRPRRRVLLSLMVAGGLLLFQANYSASQINQSVSARYNPLHWFVADAIYRALGPAAGELSPDELPESLRTVDMSGRSLLGEQRVKNVLILTLEGLPGIYHPEIRRQLGIADGPFQMDQLAEATRDAMLVPEFVAHSHQTIRGLYAIHCGDMSKLSYDAPKGLELLLNPQRAAQCLPARLANAGYQTHFLQGAPLQFMNKDRIMPAMGFQQVHGLEWFTDRAEKDFIWGTTDPDFFAGATRYVRQLQQQDRPWLLSLLTVATHQPFDAPQDLIERYGSRKIAAVARLDAAAAGFIERLRQDGLLDTTLVIVTSDESHGYDGEEWYTSWGRAAIMAPGEQHLPRAKNGVFGLMDIQATVLDYLQLPMPPSIIGRSMFREYATSREMASYTSGKLRWQTADNRLFECSVDGVCQVSQPAGILRPNRTTTRPDPESAAHIFALARVLDNKLIAGMRNQQLEFGHGEIRLLPEKIRNEWADNLVGAQYLDFPENSRVEVDIRIKAVTAAPDGVQLKLVMRQFEHVVGTIVHPPFPVLQAGESCQVRFGFDNPEARKSFSFHLVGEGRDSSIQLEKFEVKITRDS